LISGRDWKRSQGFWGTYVVGCGDRPLVEPEALKPSADLVTGQRRGSSTSMEVTAAHLHRYEE
jgi:hypothetical protein